MTSAVSVDELPVHDASDEEGEADTYESILHNHLAAITSPSSHDGGDVTTSPLTRERRSLRSLKEITPSLKEITSSQVTFNYTPTTNVVHNRGGDHNIG